MLLAVQNSLAAQDTLFNINGVVDFRVDPIGQLFYLREDGSLARRDVAADSTYTFNDNLLGPISSIDVSNPFGPILYFEDYFRLLLLDRTLNEVSSLDLQSSSVLQAAGIFARNFNDQVWIFDEGDFRLKLLAPGGKVVKQSDDLRRRMGLNRSPKALFAAGNLLYVHYPERGIAVFSNYGRFLRWELEDLKVETLQFDGRTLFWRDGPFAYQWSFSGPARSIKLPLMLADTEGTIWPLRGGWLYLSNSQLFYLK
ncbi:hypothetical protein CEQ90_07350 [Lewinellaceae bacterium SD302]|nr:hypothetical protein CEQ90_07350 [Lewinellaceae bacterium SD302]